MPTEKNRVYIEDAKEAPDDVIVQRGARGRLYYRTDERGENNEVGGNHTNELLEQQDNIEEGAVFYDTVNETEAMLTEVNNDTASVRTGSASWEESVEDVRRNIESGDWVHLEDDDRVIEMQDDDEPEEPEAKFDIDDWVRWDYGDGTSDGQVKDKKTEIGGTLSVDGNTRNVGETDPEPIYKMDVWREGDEELRGQAVKSENEIRSIEPPEAAKSVDKQRMIGKPFEGPNGQGPYDSFNACVKEMDGKVDSPEGLCATWHHEDTGEWPAEKYKEKLKLPDCVPEDTTVKVYIPSTDQTPDNKVISSDEKGLYFKAQAYEIASASYPTVVVDEYDYEMPNGEMASEDSGVDEEYETQQQQLLSDMEEAYS
jgi:hypothetical protein